MEGPGKPKINHLEKIGQVVALAAALSGAVDKPEVSAATVPPATHIEHHETFNAEKEAKAFLDKVESLDVGIDDARGRRNLLTIVGEDFDVFVLALAKGVSYFSSDESTSLAGTLTPGMRERARLYLTVKLSTRKVDGNPGLEALQTLLRGPHSIRDSL
ncbi:MAG: hypothetical protein WAN50_01120 [Minisyncoccia bacterium]